MERGALWQSNLDGILPFYVDYLDIFPTDPTKTWHFLLPDFMGRYCW